MNILFAILAALLLTPPAAETPECEAIHALIGGELEPWLGYDNGAWGWPDDVRRVATIDFAVGGLREFRSQSLRGTRWLLWYRSFELTGNPLGAHDFCGPYRITDD